MKDSTCSNGGREIATAVASATPKQRSGQNTKRSPLISYDNENAVVGRPKSREVTSRYLSVSTSSSASSVSSSSVNTVASFGSSRSSISNKIPESPVIGNRGSILTPKGQHRGASTERRRPAVTPSTAERVLVKSLRNLSLSFQGPDIKGNYILDDSRKATPGSRKSRESPLKDRKEKTGSKSIARDERHQNPCLARSRSLNSSFLSRSVNYGSLKQNESAASPRKSVEYDNRSKIKPPEKQPVLWPRAGTLDSNVDSITSQGYSTGIASKSKEGQIDEATIHQQRVNPGSSQLRSTISKAFGSFKSTVSKKIQNGSSPREVFPRRGISPLRGAVREASPGKALPSSDGTRSRGMSSPLKARSGSGSLVTDNSICSPPSVLSFAADTVRGKLGENKVADVHDLRMLYNRLLQWRFANGRLDNALVMQKQTAQRRFFEAWAASSNLRFSVKSKKTEMVLLKHNIRLFSIIKEQMRHLENWAMVEASHWSSVNGTIKALETNIVRLPIVKGARANIFDLQEAISSAVETMQAISSSIFSLQVKAKQMSLLASELAVLSAQEHYLLIDCQSLFSTEITPLQVRHCSLRTQLLQVAATLPSPPNKTLVLY